MTTEVPFLIHHASRTKRGHSGVQVSGLLGKESQSSSEAPQSLRLKDTMVLPIHSTTLHHVQPPG